MSTLTARGNTAVALRKETRRQDPEWSRFLNQVEGRSPQKSRPKSPSKLLRESPNTSSNTLLNQSDAAAQKTPTRSPRTQLKQPNSSNKNNSGSSSSSSGGNGNGNANATANSNAAGNTTSLAVTPSSPKSASSRSEKQNASGDLSRIQSEDTEEFLSPIRSTGSPGAATAIIANNSSQAGGGAGPELSAASAVSFADHPLRKSPQYQNGSADKGPQYTTNLSASAAQLMNQTSNSSAMTQSMGGAGGNRTLNQVMEDGVRLYGGGWLAYGADGFLPSSPYIYDPVHIPNVRADRIVSIACGEMHTLLLTDDGAVWSFGNAEDGRLGHGSSHNELFPRMVTRLRGKRVVQVAAGARHSAAVTADGLLFVWGRSDHGQLGIKGVESSYFPRLVSEPFVKEQRFVSRVACGSNHTVVLSGGGAAAIGSSGAILAGGGGSVLWASGSNSCGQLGVVRGREESSVPTFTLVKWDRHRKIVSLAAGDEHSAAVDSEGGLWTWGNGIHGQLMNADCADRAHPAPIYIPGDCMVRMQAPATASSGQLTRAGSPNASFYGTTGTRPASSVMSHNRPSTSGSTGSFSNGAVRYVPPKFSLVICGYAHTLAVTEDGVAFVGGWNAYGQLGLGHQRNVAIPTRLSAFEGRKIIDAAAGFKHTVIITDECKAFAFGDNTFGQLGLGRPHGLRLPSEKSVHGSTNTFDLGLVPDGIGVLKEAVTSTPTLVRSLSSMSAKSVYCGCYSTLIFCDLLSLEEKNRLVEIFKSIDTGNDGTLSENEIGVMFAKLGRPLLKSERRLLMKAIDTNSNGYISLEEFLSHYVPLVSLLEQLDIAQGRKPTKIL
ncbi:mitochondrial regulator of chromosome condensation (RCC1) domain-containing protein (AgRCC1_3) [Andalucia godoyi]|uniref:Mitochondrial regulator of chromosome condensation (RCC1) domain-containing protein (AgRCC1_3) n=1 Tax=Andalucia godoyi TaxID=505711 RepID=A0A8K0AJ27_ANDGO|nr:mitochondrial regulator of chromosome condensation (RCC1) domain-containing protein (AgRCC1_3) [Andalucia godoyi]|eukprot:ANDGO_02644.mRNA.1 mitochondrial regulator of chromosome condensation (RCC1) domain-containing protein (AgRCC1_3)